METQVGAEAMQGHCKARRPAFAIGRRLKRINKIIKTGENIRVHARHLDRAGHKHLALNQTAGWKPLPRCAGKVGRSSSPAG